MDTHDGFGGVGAQTLQHLADEYTSKSVMTFGFSPANLPDDVILKLIIVETSLLSDIRFPDALVDQYMEDLGVIFMQYTYRHYDNLSSFT